MSTKPILPTKNFNDVALTEKLDPEFLQSLNLDDLKRLKRNLVKRAADVVGEIGELNADDDFEQQQYAARLFRCELEHQGEILFRHELSREKSPVELESNFFVPGMWFKKYTEELEDLRAKKAAYVAAFPEHQKQRMIELLLSGKNFTNNGKD